MRVREIAGLVLLIGAAPAGAQQAPPSSGFGERVDVEVVNVDVIVTDADGDRVTDLERDEFILEVDKREVPVEYFSPPAARAPEWSPATVPAPAAQKPEAAEPTRANLFVFVDQSALEWRTSKQILDEIAQFVLPRTGGDELIMVAAFANNLKILSPPTGDRARIEAALEGLQELRGRGSLAAAERWQLEREVRENSRPRAQVQILDPETGEVSGEQAEREAQQERTDTAMLRGAIEAFAEQELDRQVRAVAALRSWIGALGAIEGRKSVLFASSGYTARPGEYLSRFLDQKRGTMPTDRYPAGDLQTEGISLLDDFESAVRAAQNARVAFYTISPREIDSQPTAEDTSAGEISKTPPPRDLAIAEAASSLQRLAVATGGDALVLDDGLSERLAAVSDDAAAAYSLGFTTGAGAGDADHRIRVRVRRPGLEVRHRESFRRSTLGERAEAALIAAATLETTTNPLALRLELGEPSPLDKKGKESLVPLLIRIPLSLVALVPSGERRQGRLLARVAVQNEARELRLGTPAPIAIDVPESELERALTSFWAYRAEVMVGRGRQRVAIVVADEVAGTVSTLTTNVGEASE